MIPLIPALALAFFSFLCSAFVILRIVIPILPPHPLSKRVSPAEFGLPKFRSLSAADKSHIWLASLDLLALAIFVWQTINESVGGPSDYANSTDAASAVRLWFVMTMRQTCLLVVAAISLLHVRLGRSVSFGARHWMLWAPTLVLVITSTAVAGVIAGTGVESLFIGLIGYTSTIAVLSSVAFACLIGTLVIIKRNLAALNEETEPWPPVRMVEEKPRPSFATEEIDAIRDGASWITSNASSRQNSISGWSFSTHHTAKASSHHGHGSGRPQTGSHPSVPAKSSYWFNPSMPNVNDVPPVPPIPSQYGVMSPSAEDLISSDPDPFRRDPSPVPAHPRMRLDSQTSWLTSTNGSMTTVSAWSYPASIREGTIHSASTIDLHTPLTPVSRSVTPKLANAQVLGGYGFAPGSLEAEKGLAALAAPSGTTLDISMIRLLGWLIIIWVPIALSFPYLITVSQRTSSSTTISLLFVLSVTMSSPLLALTILFRSPLPIPSGLFDIRPDPPAHVLRGPSPANTESTFKVSYDYKRSMSTTPTVVEGRRSGDVWLTNGDAVDGKNKMSRAIGMLSPMPKLSVLPPEEDLEDGEFTPPLPIQNDDSSLPVNIHNGTPHSETSAQFGRLTSSKSSHFSGGDESLAFASKIMIAQKHYSAIAQTVVVASSSPERPQPAETNEVLGSASGATAAKGDRRSAHLRSRSVSSVSASQTPPSASLSPSPPPSFPLPPTPPTVRAARLASLVHKKSFSSGFSFGPVDDMNEIDALTAGVLPLLVPGINMDGVRIKEGDWTPPGTFSKSKGKKATKKLLAEFGEDFSSPQIHSTPARRRTARERKISHKKNHFSLPSLGLGKDGVHSLANWGADIRGALEHKVVQYTAIPSNIDLGRRNTVFGGESALTTVANLQTVQEHEDYTPVATKGASLGRAMSTRSLGLRAEVPHSIDTARSSVVSVALPSAASTVTLFDEFAAGLEDEPLAQSTPHTTVSGKPKSRHAAPPMPKQNRRSSIVYVKSDDYVSPTNPAAEPTPTSTSTMSALAQWSSRAVRPLIPKASKLQRKMSNADSALSGTKPGSPGGNLRPLTLLQDRDTNTASPVMSATRPLTLGKRQKARGAAPEHDENAIPDSASSRNSKTLKPLTLARSDTSKLRGVLRKSEALPDVVVRPPSTTDHTGFAYSFNRD
ncbi:hypothetical protein DXG03_000164 [Asterophora parasitica]|uniref:Uncharacterized protein n=1 Tax=Asterophora parasitica TaxID=117018 RepID=A0A9P7GGD2_9AGAR|nr:hypothetical protein DXG03_000164 [Asterophora parasitica]